MSHTYTDLTSHVVFSTKDRERTIDDELAPRLHAYLGGIVRQLDGKALAVGGTADHVHLLVTLPPTTAPADAMRLIKTNSSKWVHETFPRRRRFSWQPGYGAFSVSQSIKPAVAAYIGNQAEHHRQKSFQEEFRALLEKHAIAYDEQYL